MLNVFFKDKTQYNNQLNPVKGYLEQLTKYISVRKQISLEEAKQKALVILKTHFKDKNIKYFEREENGDRFAKDGTLYSYIKNNIANKNILAPTFTSYKNAQVEKSIHSEFIFVNVKARSIAKKAAQKAKAEGNIELFISKDNEQNTKKTANNSLSGVYSQESCVLYNPTNHSTLTSVTRTMTSLSNANNEKLIAGNRYYPRAIDVLNNVVYISTYTNEQAIKNTVEKYNLHLPTVEETVKILKYSSDLYFIDDIYYKNKIIPYLNNLSPYQLASICYSGDFYHLRVLNSNFIHTLLSELILPVKPEEDKVKDLSSIHQVDEAVLYFVHSIFFSKIKGFGKDYEKMNDAGLASPILATCHHVKEVLYKYKDFFNTFFMTEIFPSNSFRLKNMRRRTVVLSDTDSTCFTLDDWVTWYKGEYKIDDVSIALAGCISYIASQVIVNLLAILSRNMNVDESLLNTLALKNEYLWSSFIPCEVSKHYYAQTVMQEGNVFKAPDTERKGVHLKNSAVPKSVILHANGLMDYILKALAENQKVKFNYVVSEIIKLEQDIIASVKKGEAVYLKKSKIKNKEAYAQDEMKSPYQRHQFWVDVFSPKYGVFQDPPYDVIKVPTLVKGKAGLEGWLNSIQDLELKERLTIWLDKYNKKDLPTIYLNEIYVAGNGIPEEIINVINIKQIVFDTTMQHRLILETLGVLLNEDFLISEQFKDIEI